MLQMLVKDVKTIVPTTLPVRVKCMAKFRVRSASKMCLVVSPRLLPLYRFSEVICDVMKIFATRYFYSTILSLAFQKGSVYLEVEM